MKDRKSIAIATACTMIVLGAFGAVNVGLSVATLNSGEQCTSGMVTFMSYVALSSIILLSIFMFGLVLAAFGLCSDFFLKVAGGYAVVMSLVVTAAGGALNLTTFIWGIIVLTSKECEGTMYYPVTIVFVVLAGLGLLSIPLKGGGL